MRGDHVAGEVGIGVARVLHRHFAMHALADCVPWASETTLWSPWGPPICMEHAPQSITPAALLRITILPLSEIFSCIVEFVGKSEKVRCCRAYC